MAKKSKGKNNKKKQENKVWYIIAILFAIIIIALVAVIFSSYALWNDIKTQKQPNLIATGCFSISLNDIDEYGLSTNIGLFNTYPITDEKGKNLSPYQFTITNTCDVNAQYRIALSKLDYSNLDTKFIKYLFNNNNDDGTIMFLSNAQKVNLDNETLSTIKYNNNQSTVTESYLLDEGNLSVGESKTYNLRLWMGLNAGNNEMSKGFYGVVSVTSISAN